MKTKILSLLLIVAIITGACKKDSDKGLTPETQTGANTFSCKINGVIFTPKQDLFGPTPLFSQINQFNGAKTLVIFANNPNTSITNFNFNILDFKGEGEYSISIDKVSIECYLNIPAPNKEKIENGKIIITKYDGNIVSGTFEFNFKHGAEVFNVLQWRFDLLKSITL